MRCRHWASAEVSTPQIIEANRSDSGFISLKWQPTYEGGVNVYRDSNDGNGFQWQISINAPNNVYNDEDGRLGHSYYIQAYDADGNRAQRSAVRVAGGKIVQKLEMRVGVRDSKVSVQWTRPQGVAGRMTVVRHAVDPTTGDVQETVAKSDEYGSFSWGIVPGRANYYSMYAESGATTAVSGVFSATGACIALCTQAQVEAFVANPPGGGTQARIAPVAVAVAIVRGLAWVAKNADKIVNTIDLALLHLDTAERIRELATANQTELVGQQVITNYAAQGVTPDDTTGNDAYTTTTMSNGDKVTVTSSGVVHTYSVREEPFHTTTIDNYTQVGPDGSTTSTQIETNESLSIDDGHTVITATTLVSRTDKDGNVTYDPLQCEGQCPPPRPAGCQSNCGGNTSSQDEQDQYGGREDNSSFGGYTGGLNGSR